MTKFYKCAVGCGSVEESDTAEVPVCCGEPMQDVLMGDFSGCGGCCSACSGCGVDFADDEEQDVDDVR